MNLPPTTDDFLLEDLPPADLIRYSRVSREAQHIVSSYIERNFSLETLLSPFFTSEQVLQLRELQFRTGALITGPAALQFFDRVGPKHPQSDRYLELLVVPKFAKPLGVWLESIMGYEYMIRNSKINFTEHLDLVLKEPGTAVKYAPSLNFVFKSPNRSSLESGPNTIFLLIMDLRRLFAQPTSSMNFITHEKAYCLYPRGTLKDRRSLCFNAHSCTPFNVGFYAQSGLTLINKITPDMLQDTFSAFAPGIRRVGDSKCWTIPIHPRLELPESKIEANTWVLNLNKRTAPRVEYTLLESQYLRFHYTVGDGTLHEHLLKILELHASNNTKDTQELDSIFKKEVKSYKVIERHDPPPSLHRRLLFSFYNHLK